MIKRLLLKIWLQIWFYFLAGIQIVVYFPFLVIILLFPKGYEMLYWVARNIWARIILHGSGYYVKVENKENLISKKNRLSKNDEKSV